MFSRGMRSTYGPIVQFQGQIFRWYASKKLARSLEAVTSRFLKNYSVPKEVEQKDSTSLRPHTVDDQEGETSKYYIRHNYIPMTRKSLAKTIMQEETLISPDDHERFHEFAVALDHSVGRLYHGILGELKSLYDPLNPDKETMVTRFVGIKERQDREYELLQKLSEVLDTAGFYELPKEAVLDALKEHDIGDGVLVTVDPSKYDILRIWVVGKDFQDDNKKVGWARKASKSVRYRVYGRQSTAERYKRVIIAVRAKQQSKLILKTFKDIPCPNLEHLLPEGKVGMTRLDQMFIGLSLTIGLTTVAVKLMTSVANHYIGVLPIVAVTAAVLLLRTWSVYNGRRNQYLADLTQTLYFKSLANNRALLTLVVDRAEDEAYKSVMLAYSFIRASSRLSLSEESPSDEEYTDGVTSKELQSQIEGWMANKFGLNIDYDQKDSVNFLADIGILQKTIEGEVEMLRVLPINECMPLTDIPVAHGWSSPIDRTDDIDLHHIFESDHKEEMKIEEAAKGRIGWH